nr:retron St85 family RNA-directed DNA polymerase [Xanthomonas sp. XNM01]
MESSHLIRVLSLESGLLPEQVANIVRTAPFRYKSFKVKKRTGGLRQLAQPAKEVKWIQSRVVDFLRPLLPMHDAVNAYEVGSSIKKNAGIHASSRFLLKMDFSNFFPSILESDIVAHINCFAPSISEVDAFVITRSCMWANGRKFPLQLCIGAPSSPFLSNSVMYSFDDLISKKAAERDITYTRYADDLTFSSRREGILADFQSMVEVVISEILYPRLKLNTAKTLHASRAGRRVVTGIVITPEGELSVGRDRKRLVRAMAHRDSMSQLDSDGVDKLEGLINFIDGIEPGFAQKARRWRNKKVAGA